MLEPEKYIKVIELTSLVSIDLVIKDKESKILMGKRVNEPAKNLWFVPGSRVYKNEDWKQDAIKRISKDELGCELDYKYTNMIGVYDHFYDTNFLNKKDEKGNMISTHYVCIALQASLQKEDIDEKVFLEQHSELKWMNINEILMRDDVHQNVKNYFI